MSEIMVTVEDAAFRLAELVEAVSVKRESTVLTKAGHPIARIVPITPLGEPSGDLLDFLRRWRTEHPEPDDQLAEVTIESRRGVRAVHDPWE